MTARHAVVLLAIGLLIALWLTLRPVRRGEPATGAGPLVNTVDPGNAMSSEDGSSPVPQDESADARSPATQIETPRRPAPDSDGSGLASGMRAPIPIPPRLTPLFDDGEDWSAAHAEIEQEPREPAWATFNEQGIQNFLSSNPALAEYEILSLECRTRTCEVLLVGHGEAGVEITENSAVRTLFEELFPAIGDQAWFEFTGASINFDELDSGAVGFQLILAREDAGVDSGTPDGDPSGDGGGRRLDTLPEAENPIQLPPELTQLLESDDAWAEFHARLERESEDLSWSTFMEGRIAEYMGSVPELAELAVLTIECRSVSCEMQAIADGPGPWQLELIGMGQEPWFEFERWEMASGQADETEPITLLIRFDGENGVEE